MLCPFPPVAGSLPGTYIRVHHKNLYPLPPKNLIINHKVKTVDMLNWRDNFRSIRNYITNNAAITFLIPNLLNAITFWDSIHNLCSKYKYTVHFYHSISIRQRKLLTDEFIPFVTFGDAATAVVLSRKKSKKYLGWFQPMAVGFQRRITYLVKNLNCRRVLMY